MILFRDTLPKLTGKIRFLQAIPIVTGVDIYDNGELIYTHLNFGNVSDYFDMPIGRHLIQIYYYGSYASPISSNLIEISSDTMLTLNLTINNNEFFLFEIDDTKPAVDKSLSYVRFINTSSENQILSLFLPNNKLIFDKINYLEATNYTKLSPGIYNFIVTNTFGTLNKFISQVNLSENTFITIYIIGLVNAKPIIGYILLND